MILLAVSGCHVHVRQTADVHLLAHARKKTYPLPPLNLLNCAWLGRYTPAVHRLLVFKHFKQTGPIPHAGSG